MGLMRAGDAFNAAFLSALAAGADLPASLTCAVGVASAVVGSPSERRYALFETSG